MSKEKRIEIKKIPLKDFIETLIEIYNRGTDYVNIIAQKGTNQDSIWITEDVPEKEEKSNDVNFEGLA